MKQKLRVIYRVYSLSKLTFVCFQLAGWWHHPESWKRTNVSFPLLLAPQDFSDLLTALLSLWSPDPLCFLHFSFSFSQRSFEEFAICTYQARIVIDNSSMLHVCIRIFLFVITINAKMRKNFNVKKKASIILSVKLLNSYAIFKKFWRVESVLSVVFTNFLQSNR